jgi:hypothetical protein
MESLILDESNKRVFSRERRFSGRYEKKLATAIRPNKMISSPEILLTHPNPVALILSRNNVIP